MGTYTINPIPVAPLDIYPYATGQYTQALDATNDGVGAIFLAPKAGNISKLFCNITAKTGTAPTYRLGLETPTTTRQPDGTILGSGTAKVDLTNPSTGAAWRTLDTPLAVTAGQPLAITMRYQSGTVDASNFATVSYATQNFAQVFGLPYPLSLTAGTWARNVVQCPSLSAQYDDGEAVCGMFTPTANATNSQWNSGSNPLYRGSKWTPPVGVRLWGVCVMIREPDNADFRVKVFEGSNTTPILTSTTIDADVLSANNAGIYVYRIPFTPTQLTQDTIYRFVVEPTTTNNNSSFVQWPMIDASGMAAVWGGLSLTTSPSAISWTDTATTIAPVVPVIDQIITSGGGTPLGGGKLISVGIDIPAL